MGLSDIGNLMCLPFDEIEPGPETEAHEYLLQEASNLLQTTQRNWLPLIVKEVGLDTYEVVANSFVYEAISRAGLKEAWCIIADDDEGTALTSLVLAHDKVPKANLSQASREQISAALDYLLNQPKTPLKGVNLVKATSRINEAPARKYWKTLKPITQLGCNIGAGVKVKELEKIFYLEPEPMPEVITDPTLLKTFTTGDLKKMAKKRGITGYSKLKKAELVNMLAA
ncbi:MAG: Rho termination factor N-terminal domain-containing protein [Cyanobacteria bacterium P01_B01_bin.77]